MADKRPAKAGWASSIVGLFTTGKVEKRENEKKRYEDAEDVDIYPSSSTLIDMRPKIKASGINRTRSILNELEKLSSPNGSKSITPQHNVRNSASFSQSTRPQRRSIYTPARVQEQSLNLSRSDSRTPYSSFPYTRPNANRGSRDESNVLSTPVLFKNIPITPRNTEQSRDDSNVFSTPLLFRDIPVTTKTNEESSVEASNVFSTPMLFRDIPVAPQNKDESQPFESPRIQMAVPFTVTEDAFSAADNAITTELSSVPQITLSKPLVGGFFAKPVDEVEAVLEFDFLKPILRDPNANAKPVIFPEDDNSSNSETDGSSISPLLRNSANANNEESTKENDVNTAFVAETTKWDTTNGPATINARPKLVAHRRLK